MKASATKLRSRAYGQCASAANKAAFACELINKGDITVARMVLQDVARHAAQSLKQLKRSRGKGRPVK